MATEKPGPKEPGTKEGGEEEENPEAEDKFDDKLVDVLPSMWMEYPPLQERLC